MLISRSWTILALVGWVGAVAARCAIADAADPAAPTGPSGHGFVVDGVTFPTPGRVSEIAAAVLHPVEKVLVRPGDVVRAGQALVELDADEPRAEVRAKQARVRELTSTVAKLKGMPRAEERAEAKSDVESKQIAVEYSRIHVNRLEDLRKHDAISAREYLEQKTNLARNEAEHRSAQAQYNYLLKLPIEHEIAEAEHQLAVAVAECDAAEHELEHYTVHAAIDGIVAWLDVTPGTVARPGTKVWGEIVDLSEVDVRIQLTPAKLREADLKRPIHVEHAELGQTWTAKFVYASPTADRATGLIPVVVRVADSGEALRAHLPVTVHIERATARQAVTGAVSSR